MKKIYEYLKAHLKRTYWLAIAWQFFLIATFFIVFTLLALPESFLLFVVLLLLYTIPLLLLFILSFIALFQAFEKKHTILAVFGYMTGTAFMTVLFIPFFFFVAFSLFGFS